jgi:hypothetical protein
MFSDFLLSSTTRHEISRGILGGVSMPLPEWVETQMMSDILPKPQKTDILL